MRARFLALFLLAACNDPIQPSKARARLFTPNAVKFATLKSSITVHEVDTVVAPRKENNTCNWKKVPYRTDQPKGRSAIVQERDETTCGAAIYYVTLPNPGKPNDVKNITLSGDDLVALNTKLNTNLTSSYTFTEGDGPGWNIHAYPTLPAPPYNPEAACYSLMTASPYSAHVISLDQGEQMVTTDGYATVKAQVSLRVVGRRAYWSGHYQCVHIDTVQIARQAFGNYAVNTQVGGAAAAWDISVGASGDPDKAWAWSTCCTVSASAFIIASFLRECASPSYHVDTYWFSGPVNGPFWTHRLFSTGTTNVDSWGDPGPPDYFNACYNNANDPITELTYIVWY